MTILQVSETLTKIRDNYAGIVRMCETFNLESKPENYTQYVLRRATILSDIEHEQNILNTSATDWKELCIMDSTLAKISCEIQTFISAILALDTTIKSRLTRKMDDVKKELSSIGKKSRAVLAYAKH